MALDNDLFEKIKVFTKYTLTREGLMGYEEFYKNLKESVEAEGIHLTADDETFDHPDILALVYYVNYLIISKIENTVKEMAYLRPSFEDTVLNDNGVTVQ